MVQTARKAGRQDRRRSGLAITGSVLWLVSVLGGGCATSAGDRAFRAGQFQQAADAFEAELKREPGDRSLRERLHTARRRAIEADLQRAEELRDGGQGQAAVVLVGRTLLRAEAWEVSLPPETERRLAVAVEASDRHVREQVTRLVAEKSPLSARAQLDRFRPILAARALRPTMAAADQAIREGGRVRCAELAGEVTAGESPYWHWALGRYCAALGAPQPGGALPGLFKGLRVTIRTKDSEAAERPILEEWLAELFKQSVWYADDASELLGVRVENDFDASLEKRPATLHASYRKRATRTLVDESQILAPTREYTVESEEDFVYSATLYVATYRLDAVVTVDLGGGQDPFVAHLKGGDSKRAYDHDVTFPPANIYPKRPHLLSAADWLKKYLEHEVKPLSRRLSERWIRVNCGVAGRTLEGASRCLFAGQPSTQAEGVIQKKLGKDGTPALALFAKSAAVRDGASQTGEPSDDEPSKSPAPKIETVPAAPRANTI